MLLKDKIDSEKTKLTVDAGQHAPQFSMEKQQEYRRRKQNVLLWI